MYERTIINKSMRQNYGEFGVDTYYTMVGSSYRNPHFPSVKKCLFTWMDMWWFKKGNMLPSKSAVRIMDMAAGSGEVTICLQEWWASRRTQSTIEPASNIPPRVTEDQGMAVRPPRPSSRPTVPIPQLGENSPYPSVAAVDPYTADAYKERTGCVCYPLNFQDVAAGQVPPFGEEAASGNDSAGTAIEAMEMVICSFALHLVESPSQMFSLLWELSTKAKWLVVISPHKKPDIKNGWGWTLWNVPKWCPVDQGPLAELLIERVHCRVYRSLNA